LKNFSRSLLGAAFLAALLLALTAAPASASVCGQRVLDDWYDDGRVATTYPIHCYREAIADLPEDVQSYSSAEEDISAAMLAAIAANERENANDRDDNGGTSTNGRNSAGSGGNASGGGGGGSGSGGNASNGPDQIAGTPDDVKDPGTMMEGRSGADAERTGPVTQAMDKIGPSSADSFPLALVIVGLLGLLLLAAGGASFVKQRVRGRRLSPPRPHGR
jgi:hypothetical protein